MNNSSPQSLVEQTLSTLNRMSGESTKRNGAYIETFTGKKFYLFDEIRDEDIDWNDIAHALSMQCRYNGHCNRFYSVAEHSVIMSHILPKEFALYALLHDGSEAYLSDIPSPFKPYLLNYKELELKVQTRIYEVAGLNPVEPQEVREVDRAMLLLEAEHLLHSRGKDWDTYEEIRAHYDKRMTKKSWMVWCWTPERAREKWLKRFYQLMEERGEVKQPQHPFVLSKEQLDEGIASLFDNAHLLPEGTDDDLPLTEDVDPFAGMGPQ